MARKKSLGKRVDEGVDRVRGGVARVKAGAWRAQDYASEKAGFLSEKTKDFIRERPIESVLIAAGVGILIGIGAREMAYRREMERKRWKNRMKREFRNWF